MRGRDERRFIAASEYLRAQHDDTDGPGPTHTDGYEREALLDHSDTKGLSFISTRWRNDPAPDPVFRDGLQILRIFKEHGIVKHDDARILRSEDVRNFFIHMDKCYKTQKISMSELFARTLQSLRALPGIIKQAKLHNKAGNPNGGAPMDDPSDYRHNDDMPSPRVEVVVEWEKIKMQRIIGGLKVLFPFPTMAKAQIQILAKLINALKNAEHVILESPTGTGKTAAILSGVLSWMYQGHVQNTVAYDNPSDESQASTSSSSSSQAEVSTKVKARVVYLTRTHAQIKQVMAAIKKSGFRPKSCCIASRLQLCIYKPKKHNEDEENEGSDNDADDPKNRVNSQCRQFIANVDKARASAKQSVYTCSGRLITPKPTLSEQMCPYYLNLGCKNYAISTALRLMGSDNATWDIEDLISYGMEPSHPDASVGCRCNEQADARPTKKREGDITNYFTRKSHYEPPPSQDGVCPYYTAKAVAQVADFVVCPYPYIIDPHTVVRGNAIPNKVATILTTDTKYQSVKSEIIEIISEKTNISGSAGNGIFSNLNNTVLIFDEGHNLENSCIEEASWDVGLDYLKAVLKWLFFVRAKIKAMDDIDLSDNADKSSLKAGGQLGKALVRVITFLQELIEGLEKFLHSTSDDSSGRRKGNSYERVVHSWDRYDQLQNPLGGSAEFIEAFNLDITKVYIVYCSMMQIKSQARTLSLSGVRLMEDYIFQLEYMLAIMVMLCHMPECYNVQIVANGDNAYSLGIWLMNPAVMFNELALNARSIVIASGTLAPIPPMVASLGAEFEKRLKNNVISASQTLTKNQLALYTVTHVSNCRYNNDVIECNFKNLKDNAFLLQLGNSIAKLLEVLPGGTLIFFPNRSAVSACVQLWGETFYDAGPRRTKITILERIMQCKDMNFYQEPTLAADFAVMLKELHEQREFVLFAVYRSHSSEGLNLKLSSLILVGLPFPSIVAPKVGMTRRYHKSQSEPYNWYLRETYRAVNQSIGRCIRTKDDRGVVILLDRRYTAAKEYLPYWIHPYSRAPYTVEGVRDDIEANFKF
ncbi:REGULATOR OF TELOMERE ELONGATION HELICASE 1, putative [Babesia bigemina]|uniref:REGULATOR OF TELOMERE ELONGATION HELICASE 1, putative n=1 Tax=Babesia bigemina TaxID=5866 RepID=A0A061DCW4_BABBI|nr:REGULATOR OF TELOMERE ELONGATION HELICASE 1, putative [Babesia bigemina]CDR96934.1 REGULATOR OF TELOMERE ELONGATION HELICASE 1, putative [Babesia bigemina]|eukprot:XP_012769120.1 REGULATOR OF TELOMERE ELONGATION HELICASE 1, putative [Babesia bigemina]